MPGKGGAIVWASFVALAGLFYSYWSKRSVFIFSSAACAVTFTFLIEYPFSAFSACVIFLSLIPIPFYFYRESKNMKKIIFKKWRT
jgi:hypothetical protein